MDFRQTQASDVCGAMDELKRLAVEEPERLHAQARELALPLLEDGLYMIGRMRERLAEYEGFRETLRSVLADLDAIAPVSPASAQRGEESLRAWVEGGAPVDADGVGHVHEAAEDVRAVASDQENRLRRYKELALALHDAFQSVRGSRAWLVDDSEKAPLIDQLRRRYQAWLPPEPAGSKALEWLVADALHIADAPLPDGQPLVLFRDGGAIPMSKLRWSDELGNFYPAGRTPGSTGTQFRGRNSSGHRRAEP
jgi:hypothetical protein